MLSEGSIVAICTCVVTVTTLYFQNKKNAEQLKATAKENAESSKARAEDLKVAVDGKISTLIQKVEAEGILKEKVASLTGIAAGKEEGEAKATLAALQHDQLAAARALPPTDAKIVNGGKVQPEQQTDRIEKTGDDTNERVQMIEINTDKRVGEIETNLEEKKNK